LHLLFLAILKQTCWPLVNERAIGVSLEDIVDGVNGVEGLVGPGVVVVPNVGSVGGVGDGVTGGGFGVFGQLINFSVFSSQL
jgi:hypothetical protein